MTNKLTLAEQEELFAKDCKLINLKYEYNGYIGDERWAIITELSVKELWEKYPLVIERYWLNHKFCGISDSSRSSVGSYRIASERNIRHQDIRIPVCEES